MMEHDRAPGDDRSVSWNPALRPDSAGAPALLSDTTPVSPHANSMESPIPTDDDALDELTETAPRTSEDRHPLNDGPPFDFDDDDFWGPRDDADVATLREETLGARTPLAGQPHAAHHFPDHLLMTSAGEHVSMPAAEPAPAPAEQPALIVTAAEEPAPISAEEPAPALVEEAVPEPPAESAPISAEELTPSLAAESAPVPAEELTPSPVADSATTPAEEPVPISAEEPKPTPMEEHEQPSIETIDTEALHETNPAADAPEVSVQEHNYEHQGETTSLEEAVQESADVPLADDTDSPALDWSASDDTFDLGGHAPPAIEVHSEAHPGPSNTTQYQAGLEHVETGEQPDAVDLDWGMAEETDFNIGATSEPARNVAADVVEGAEMSQPADQSSAPDLDWGVAGDEDLNFGAVIAHADTGAADESEKPEQSQTAEQPEAPNLDWGAAGDEDFSFGATSAPAGASTTDHPSAADDVAEPPLKAEEKDLSAMWAEALADDLLDDSVDPSAFFVDDDEGFLDDTVPQSIQNGSAQLNGSASAAGTSNKYSPTTTQGAAPVGRNSHVPHALQISSTTQHAVSSAQASPYSTYSQGSPYSASSPYGQKPPQRPAMPGSAQSFADKAKGGYSSPFDLPEDLAKKPRRKPAVHAQTTSAAQPKAPPPRSTSLYSNASSTAAQPPPSNVTPASMSPPISIVSPQAPSGGFGGAAPASKPPALTSKPSTGDFFEELPVVPKQRPSGRYAPQITAPTPPPSVPAPPQRQASQIYAPPVAPPVAPQIAPPIVPPTQPQRQASQNYAPPQAPPQFQRQPSQTYAPPTMPQLQQPERLPVFPDLAEPQINPVSSAPLHSRYSPAPPTAGAATSRYSPAPPSAPAANSRYSPAPPSNRYAAAAESHGPPRPPFAPRTSSPLAYHSTSQQEHAPPRPPSSESYTRRASLQPSVASVEEPAGMHSRSSLELVREIPEQEQKPATPSPPRSGPPSSLGSPARRATSSYTPHYESVVSPPADSSVPPLRRSQTQSPGATMKGPKPGMDPVDRPASVHGLSSPAVATLAYAPVNVAPAASASTAIAPSRRRRTFSRDLSFVKPADETVNDPLERWKGAPIFKWGLGGTVFTTFPKAIPRYGTGTAMPMVKCTPGEVKIQSAKDICPLWDPIAKFPGPLKAKGKKKDVHSWLKQSIETMDQDYKSKIFNGELAPEVRVRFEEKILLWKIVEVFVEHDGHLEGSDAVNEAVRKVLSPEGQDEPQLSSPVDIMGSSTTMGSVPTAEPIDPHAIVQLRSHLIKGDREKAVWEAVDKRLWGHAMLIASTLSKDIWKQVVQEFVRQEVKKVAGNNQSLAALYEVFAGNWEDSIDELVPASARAGFQMVSKTDRSGANTNALEGLDRWRETLLLVISNRSEGDAQALLSLGNLLAGYGRVEAAHTCYLFARSAMILGGPDDPTAHVVLLGADHVNQRFEVGRDIEPILLTEIFEFAVTLSAPTAPPAIPHLQAFKLAHAFHLTEYGYKNEAQAYCDAITTAMKSTTRLSPYYNSTLVSELDDLIKRLSEAPKDGSSSWISKPSMGKVSSSVWSSFNKFVAGDDSDAVSTGSGAAAGNDISPFAKMAGGTPTVSRSPSMADLYGSYPAGASTLAPSNAVAGSRYSSASSPYAPRTSGEQQRSRYDPQTQSPYQPVRPSLEATDRSEMSMDPLFAHQETPPSSFKPSAMHYPQPPKAQNPYAPASRPMSVNSSPNPLGSPYTPSAPMSGHQPPDGGMNNDKPSSGYKAPNSNFGPPLNSYEPPTSSYEPPSYQPYEPEPLREEEKPEEEEKKPKKKSFMDDEDDDELERRAAALKAQQKAEADRQADEAFRKAAEADAAKTQNQKKSGGWLGGWFKKSEADSPKPIRAKLGEESSFYYDPDLKKWVNKKAGATEQAKPAATPPPPRGPPGLRNTASMANLAGPPVARPGGLSTPPPPAYAQRSTSMPPPLSAPGSGSATPARSESPAGGPPAAGPALTVIGATAGGPPPSGPPSRPTTSMSNASSIDDLLGLPAPRKSGAAKKKGRSGRYVDVMAK